VDVCWVVVVFIFTNKIFMAHMTSLDLPENASYSSAQTVLELMVVRLYANMEEANEILEVEHVSSWWNI
jgi:hypothetical protein